MDKYFAILGIKPANNLEDIELVYKTLKVKYDILNAKTLTTKNEYTEKLRDIEKAYKAIYDTLNYNSRLTEEEKNMVYRLCKRNILSNILDKKYVKFPTIKSVKIEIISNKIKIEGIFQNKNHIEQIIQTEYTSYMDRNFNLLSLDFGNSTIIDNNKFTNKSRKYHKKSGQNSLKRNIHLIILVLIAFAIIIINKKSS